MGTAKQYIFSRAGDYLAQKFGIQNPTFEADSDNVIPILDGEWFIDDISQRFFQFVKVTFGKESYEANLDFIANALSDKNKNPYIAPIAPIVGSFIIHSAISFGAWSASTVSTNPSR